jgi:hypothetical protein
VEVAVAYRNAILVGLSAITAVTRRYPTCVQGNPLFHGHPLFCSDGWADRSDVTEGYESQARGSISIRIHSPNVTDFDEYYFNLNPYTNTRNPWFREFWQERFNCAIYGHHDNSSAFSEKSSETAGKKQECTGTE